MSCCPSSSVYFDTSQGKRSAQLNQARRCFATSSRPSYYPVYFNTMSVIKPTPLYFGDHFSPIVFSLPLSLLDDAYAKVWIQLGWVNRWNNSTTLRNCPIWKWNLSGLNQPSQYFAMSCCPSYSVYFDTSQGKRSARLNQARRCFGHQLSPILLSSVLEYD